MALLTKLISLVTIMFELILGERNIARAGLDKNKIVSKSAKAGKNMTKVKKTMKILLGIAIITFILLLAIYINHKIHLNKEQKLLLPISTMVEIDGHNMSVYTEGSGEKTLVFMSGGGTCSPILDFKSLYSLLSDKYRIVVVEKFGYGFSDVVDKKRGIESVLADTRAALKAAGIEAPYILCPHSMSGIEALYWAQQYPEEVLAIIGLDMAVPKSYQDYNINMAMLKLSQFASAIGITRLLPGVSDSDAITNGTLSNKEKEIYRAVFYNRTATITMLNEVKSIKENASKVESDNIPQVPMLLFASNGQGTGWDKEIWRSSQKKYIANVPNSKMIELDCPHYIHDFEYQVISEEIVEFLSYPCR